MTFFEEWAARSDTLKIYLVELTVMKMADQSLISLYLANYSYSAAERFYIPCVSGLPRLTRQSNDTLDPNHIASWGELELLIEPDYLPDTDRTKTWSDLLSPAYSFLGQPIVIKIGGEDFEYADFETIFSGRVGKINWKDTTVTLTIYDKAQDLNKKAPDYELPESSQVDEGSWDQTVPLVLGRVNNYKPTLINVNNPGGYPLKYALAAHVIEAVSHVYANGVEVFSPDFWTWNQREVSPTRKNGDGSAIMQNSGEFTGSLIRVSWMVQIDSVTHLNDQGQSGAEVGLGTFRWSRDGGASWEQSGILTWLLAPGAPNKSPAVGNATMTISGTYTSEVKRNYKILVTRGGHIGGSPSPQFKWSDDNGTTWSSAIDILDNAPIPLSHGLNISFIGSTGNWVEINSWTPVGSGIGAMSVLYANPGDNVTVEITTGGKVGDGAAFRWTNDGGTNWHTDNPVVAGAIDLFPGYSISFSDPPCLDFDAGDSGGWNGSQEYWNPVHNSLGILASVTHHIPPPRLLIEITTAGNIGGSARFKWSEDDGVTWNENNSIPNTDAIVLSENYTVSFSGPDGPTQYEVGDSGGSVAVWIEPFVIDDLWAFNFIEIPIPLADGISIQFFTQAGQDFYLWDEWTFILYSTLSIIEVAETTDISIDAQGVLSPVTGAYTELVGEIIRALIVLFAGWDGEADFDVAALTAFNTAIPYQVGLIVDSASEISTIIDDLLAGIPAIYTITLEGKFFIAEIVTPIGNPDFEFTDIEILTSPEGENANDNLYRRVYLNYDRNNNTNQNVAGVSQDRLEWLRKEWRQISARKEEVLLTYHWAADLGPIDTALVQRSEAKVLAEKLLDLYKTKHETLLISVKNQPFRVDLWNKIKIRRNKFGLDSGDIFAVIGMEHDFTASEATLTLWR